MVYKKVQNSSLAKISNGARTALSALEIAERDAALDGERRAIQRGSKVGRAGDSAPCLARWYRRSSGAWMFEFGIFALMLGLFSSPSLLSAQTADDYFHGGATNYVFGEKEKSKEQVLTGLQHFPTDPKLNGLFTLLKKEDEQKQQQQQQQNQQKNDQNKDQKQDQNQQQKNQDQKKDEQQKQQSNEQKKRDEKKQQDQAKKSDQKNQDQQNQKNDGQKNDKSDQNSEEQPQQAFAAGQMTPQQAKQLLDAQKGQEMIIPIRPEVKPRDPNKPLKDW